jgi:hypothetical protein
MQYSRISLQRRMSTTYNIPYKMKGPGFKRDADRRLIHPQAAGSCSHECWGGHDRLQISDFAPHGVAAQMPLREVCVHPTCRKAPMISSMVPGVFENLLGDPAGSRILKGDWRWVVFVRSNKANRFGANIALAKARQDQSLF